MVRTLPHLIPTPADFHIYTEAGGWVAKCFMTFFVSLKLSYLIQHFDFSTSASFMNLTGFFYFMTKASL